MQKQLDTAFAELNQKMLDRQLAWVENRRIAVKELIVELTPKRRSLGEFTYYDKVFTAAGGKTWFNMMSGRNAEQIRELVEKNVQKLIANRNAKIITALTKKGITEIPDFELTEISDGYEGIFYIGEHRVEIRTILAGGYNIQCLHQRTLVKVK
jgi:hypothetical protein